MKPNKLLIFNSRTCKRVAIINDSIINYEEQYLAYNKIQESIFVGEIISIDLELQAVLINFGMNRLGFLSFSSIDPKLFLLTENEKNILNNKLKNIEFHQIRQAPVYLDYRMEEVLRNGQKFLVQIVRDEMSTKGAMLSTFISLRGRYFRYIPNSCISKMMITKASHVLQNRLYGILKKHIPYGSVSLNQEIGNVSLQDLESDIIYLNNVWNTLKQKVSMPVGTCVYSDSSPLMKIFRTTSFCNIRKVIIEGDDTEYENLVNHLVIKPNHIIIRSKNIFKDYEKEIESLYESHINLKSGGFIKFNFLESLVIISVNIGNNTNIGLQEAVLQTNLEAVDVISKQLHIRGLHGNIIIQFLPIDNEENRKTITEAMENYFKKDNVKNIVSPISPFGIMEIFRQFTKTNFIFNLQNCSICSNGYEKSVVLIAEELIRKICYMLDDYNKIKVYINSQISEYLLTFSLFELNAFIGQKKIQFFVQNIPHKACKVVSD